MLNMGSTIFLSNANITTWVAFFKNSVMVYGNYLAIADQGTQDNANRHPRLLTHFPTADCGLSDWCTTASIVFSPTAT